MSLGSGDYSITSRWVGDLVIFPDDMEKSLWVRAPPRPLPARADIFAASRAQVGTIMPIG